MSNHIKVFLFLTFAKFIVATTELPTTTTTVGVEKSLEIFLPKVEISSKNSKEGLYHFVCTVGRTRTDNIMCTKNDYTTWDEPHDAELRLRCPVEGSGKRVAFVQIDFWVTSLDVDCQILDGGIGQDFIHMLINAKKTMSFKTVSNVYSV